MLYRNSPGRRMRPHLKWGTYGHAVRSRLRRSELVRHWDLYRNRYTNLPEESPG